MAKTTVPSQYIADNAVTTAKIAANAITAAQIAGGAIVSVDLGDNSITVASIAGNAVGSSEIAANAVGSSEIAANAVDSAELVSGSIDTAHLSADAVDGTKIADDSIDSEHYVDGSIDTAHIGDSQVTNAKLANSSVTVNSNSLSLGGTLTLDTDDIGEGSTNQYFTNARAQSAISAGTGISVSSGEISIGANALTATMISANAVGSSEIAANSVDSAEIAANAVSTSELASTAAPTFASITTTGDGDIGGNLTVTGNLQVDGTTTTINSTNLSVDDLNITVAAGAANAAAADGAGITVDGANATLTYVSTGDSWAFNKDVVIGVNDTTPGALAIYGGATGNAEGGEIRLHTGADHDTTYDHYRLDVYEDDFRIGRAGTTDLTINSSGNATFAGSVTAYSTIHATQSANDAFLRATTTGAGAYVRLDSTTSGYYGIQMLGGNPLVYKWFIGSYGTNDFTIKSEPTGTEFLRVTTGGNVGIANETPQRKLTVTDSSASSAGDNSGILSLTVGTGANTDSKMQFGVDSSHQGWIHVVKPGTNVYPLILNPTTASGGKVGIGMSPTNTLSIKAHSGASSGGINLYHFNGNKVAELLHHGSGDEGRLSLYDSGISTVQLHGETGQDSYINSGNLGIGTDNPASPLHIQADGIGLRLDGTANTTRTIFFRSTTSSNPAQIYSDGSLKLRTEDAGTDIRFHTNSTGTNNERMRIDSSGVVGIGYNGGTIAGGGLLSVNGAGVFTNGGAGYVQGSILLRSSDNDQTPSYRGQGIYTWNVGHQVSWYIGTPYTNGDMFVINRKSSETSFTGDSAYTSGTNVSPLLGIENTGKMAIGSLNYYSKVSINSNGALSTSGQVASTGVTVHNGTGGTAIQMGTYDSGSADTSYGYLQSSYINNAGVGIDYRIYTGPTLRLHISRTTNVAYTADGLFNSNARPHTWYAPSGGSFHLGYRDSGSGLYQAAMGLLYDCIDGLGNTSYRDALVLKESSNGGVEHFRVNGNGNVTNTNNSYGQISDERLKTDIVDASSQWDDIKAVRVRKFKFGTAPEGHDFLQIGVISQELEAAGMNGLIDESDPDDAQLVYNPELVGQKIKTVKYSVLYMKAIKALQEAMDRIEQLEARVTELEG